MSQRSTPALLIPLAAVLAVVFPFAFGFRQSPVSQQQEEPKPRRAVTQRQEAKEPGKDKKKLTPEKHDANKILGEFFGVKDYRTALWPDSDFRSKYTVHFLIATIPDPIDSRLPYLFDRFLGSMQRAAEADNLVLDRFDLPWIEELQKKETAKDGGESSKEAASEPAETHDYTKEPGLVLFRDPLSEKGPRLYVLFLVGETPTAGLHKDAFVSALKQIDELAQINKRNDSTLKILGPSFSGSAESMESALRSWLADPQKKSESGKLFKQIQIVSGSATAIPIAPKSDTNPRHYFDLDEAGAAVIFKTTVVPDEAALNDFFDYLILPRQSSTKEAIRVGLLTEANTAYGNSLKNVASCYQGPSNQKQAGKQTLAKQADSNAPGGGKPAEPPCNPSSANVSLIALPFPLHISRLRSESEKNRAQRNRSTQQTSQNQDTSKYLPVPFADDSEETKDAIPPFSDLETTSSELILANLLTTLSRERFDYVGIAATDVRDTIFLAREVREHSPSSVLFSLNADLVYTHPEANPNMRGMVVITPYPLFTLNQHWMDPFARRARLQFPDQNSQGVYNAMLVLLGNERQLMEYGVPFPRYSFIEKSESANAQRPQLPDNFRRPAVWLTTVGREGFWPITVILDSSKGEYTHTRLVASPSVRPSSAGQAELPAARLRGTLPHSAILVFCCWSLLCGIPAITFLRRELRGAGTPLARRSWVDNFSALPWIGDAVFTRNRGECRTYFLVAGIATLSAYVVAIAAYSITSLQPRQWGLWLFGLVAMAVVSGSTFVACVVLGRDAFGLIRRPQSSGGTNGWLAIPVLFIGVAGLSIAIWLAAEWILLRYRLTAESPLAVNGIVTGYRALNMASGVSPLLPLFLIALAACAWAISAVRRVRLAESFPWIHESVCARGQDWPGERDAKSLFNSRSPAFAEFHALESRVQELLRSPSLHLPGELRTISFVVSGVVIAAGFYLFYWRLVVALEAPIFYVLFGVCFMLVYLSIAFNTMRLLFLWLALSKVLHAMGRHRIRRAFSRFFRKYPNLPRINLTSAPEPLTALSFSLEQAGNLLRSAKAQLPAPITLARVVEGVADDIRKAESCYRDALAAEARKDQCGSLLAQLKAQRLLAGVSWCIEGSMNYCWNCRAAFAPGDEALEKKDKNLSSEAEEFLVGRVVLFLSHIFPQMSNLAGLSLASLLLLLLAVSSYPFQPHQLIVMFNWVIIFAFVGVALYMSVQMNRDTVLSNLNNTKPGELNWDRDFITRLLLYVVIPIFGFLGVQFPEALSQLFSFLSPGAAGHG
ncbi:MAG TPA: hypothetical protein VJN92_04400 [Candidatus Acidoferrum sp.]|nr:hypothetical protein [Candidatus Acidoferrum sp.]